jgi:hypothetical protein
VCVCVHVYVRTCVHAHTQATTNHATKA